MINIKDLYKSYGKTAVLKDINIQLSGGQVVGIVGPNGSGKTTLIKCVLGLAAIDSGTITFNNKLISVPGESAYRADFGYMPQIGRYPENMKIRQLFNMLKDIRKGTYHELDEELVRAYKLDGIYEKALGSLSGGTVQKVSAAIAFLFNPKILVLDEPTAGLDPVAAEILKEKILRTPKDRLIIITSHISNDLDELSTHLLFLNDGYVKIFDEIKQLKDHYGEPKLGRLIYHMMESQNKQATVAS